MIYDRNQANGRENNKILQNSGYIDSSSNHNFSSTYNNPISRVNPDNQEQNVPQVAHETLSNTATKMGLKFAKLGTSFQDLSDKLSDIDSTSEDSQAWWQSVLNHIPYLGGLIEPDSGRLLLNLGEQSYALVTGNIESLNEYMLELKRLSSKTSYFWQFPLLFGLEPKIVRQAEQIMVGSRSNDLEDFISSVRSGDVEMNDREQEAIPLLNWMAVQAGEQSTDVGENGDADKETVFAAAISDSTIFVRSNSDGLAENLVKSIENIYNLLKTAPVEEQEQLEWTVEEDLLNILEDDNRWGMTENTLRLMNEAIEELQQELKQNITDLMAVNS